MKHIFKENSGSGQCGAAWAVPCDKCVYAAMESDCDECRVAVGVARKGDKSFHGSQFGVKAYATWEREPYPGAETMLAELERFRDATDAVTPRDHDDTQPVELEARVVP